MPQRSIVMYSVQFDLQNKKREKEKKEKKRGQKKIEKKSVIKNDKLYQIINQNNDITLCNRSENNNTSGCDDDGTNAPPRHCFKFSARA